MNDEWETPDTLFEALNYHFNFDLDACATESNSKCFFYITKKEDYSKKTLKLNHTIWINPPYSRGNIDKCMEKTYKDSLLSHVAVALVRDDPSTNWYNSFVDGKASKVLRLRRRVKFKGANSCYNFPVCVVIYNGNFYSATHYKQWWLDEKI